MHLPTHVLVLTYMRK